MTKNVVRTTQLRGLTSTMTVRGIRPADIGPAVRTAPSVLLSISNAREGPENEREDEKSAERDQQ